MKKQVIHIIFFACFLLSSLFLLGQNQFTLTNFTMHKPFINPASITTFNDLNGAASFRSQWVGVEGAPTTSLLDVNTRIRSSSSYVGFTVLSDIISIHQNYNVSFTYAYRAQLDKKKFISFSLSPSLVLQQSNFSAVATDFPDQTFLSADPSKVMPNVKFGAIYEAPYFYAGISTPALLYNSLEAGTSGEYTGNTSFDLGNIHYNILVGYRREFASKWELHPAMLVKQVPGSPVQIDGLVQMQYLEKYGGGISYSAFSNVGSVLFNIQLNPNFRLSYAYSYPFNEFSQLTSGTQEIMLLFGLWNRKRSYINMPKLLEQYQKQQKGAEPDGPVKQLGRQPYSGN